MFITYNIAVRPLIITWPLVSKVLVLQGDHVGPPGQTGPQVWLGHTVCIGHMV